MSNKLLITGGTGSFGGAVLNKFLKSENLRQLEFLVVMKKNKMILEEN